MKRLLFITDGFYLAGGQTFYYELITNLFRLKSHVFSIKVINLSDLKDSDFYYKHYLDCGIEVNTIPLLSQVSFVNRVKERIFRILKIRNSNIKALRKSINKADIVVFNQIYVFNYCLPLIHKEKNVAMHLMSHSFQYDNSNMLSEFSTFQNIAFTFFCQKQLDELHQHLKNPKTSFFPLIRTIEVQKRNKAIDNDTYVIATVSRISKMRVLETFLYACHLLRRKKVRFKFIFIGDIEDESYHNHLMRLSKVLFIDDVISFCGQAKELPKTLSELNVNLLWSGPLYSSIGYGSIESIAHGYPSIFWKMDEKVDTDAYPSFSDLNKFSDYTIKLLSDPEDLKDLLKTEQESIKKNLQVDQSMDLIENFYLEQLN
ncbi:glycosyltransferase [Ekhidna sp.]|uniref:glycosyltransferase n=1 Tax=Ekhidna sp. TaxID=2608089 RepID=UPI003299AC1A